MLSEHHRDFTLPVATPLLPGMCPQRHNIFLVKKKLSVRQLLMNYNYYSVVGVIGVGIWAHLHTERGDWAPPSCSWVCATADGQ